jgi:hypothetical protein
LSGQLTPTRQLFCQRIGVMLAGNAVAHNLQPAVLLDYRRFYHTVDYLGSCTKKARNLRKSCERRQCLLPLLLVLAQKCMCAEVCLHLPEGPCSTAPSVMLHLLLLPFLLCVR